MENGKNVKILWKYRARNICIKKQPTERNNKKKGGKAYTKNYGKHEGEKEGRYNGEWGNITVEERK